MVNKVFNLLFLKIFLSQGFIVDSLHLLMYLHSIIKQLLKKTEEFIKFIFSFKRLFSSNALR